MVTFFGCPGCSPSVCVQCVVECVGCVWGVRRVCGGVCGACVCVCGVCVKVFRKVPLGIEAAAC